MDAARQLVLDNARRQIKEIDDYFRTIASWNENSKARKAGAPPIDPDETGGLTRLRAALVDMLERDEAKGHVGSIDAPLMKLVFQEGPKEIQ